MVASVDIKTSVAMVVAARNKTVVTVVTVVTEGSMRW